MSVGTTVITGADAREPTRDRLWIPKLSAGDVGACLRAVVGTGSPPCRPSTYLIDLCAYELADGAIGEVRSVRADLGIRVPFDPTNRLWDLDQGGGALLDLGVYATSLIQMVLGGRPEAIDVVGSLGPSGADAESALVWRAADGRFGLATCSLLSPLPGSAAVFGTEGWMEVPPRFHHPKRFCSTGQPMVSAAPAPRRKSSCRHRDWVRIRTPGGNRCLAAGLTESPAMPLDDTLAVMGVLEEALQRLGVHHTEDPSAI